MYRHEVKIHETSVPELNKKRRLKTEPQKSKNTPKMTPKWVPKSDTILVFFGYWGAFGGPNRFCDEKVGPQRSQSAPKNEKWANITEKWTKHEPKMAPKRAPSEKMSAKSRPFSEPSENELQKWTLWNPGPADCAKRLQ